MQVKLFYYFLTFEQSTVKFTLSAVAAVVRISPLIQRNQVKYNYARGAHTGNKKAELLLF